jgi:hypothetical protein
MASNELEWKMSTIANTLDEEVSSQEISSYCEGESRKRAWEMADVDSEKLHQP